MKEPSLAAHIEFPHGHDDQREMLLEWLAYLRGAVLRNAEGLSDELAQERPQGRLISIAGVVNHLTRVEWRWIDGGFRGAEVQRSEREFIPDADLGTLIDRYEARASATEQAVRTLTLETRSDPKSWADGHDLRWVLIHLINETARHAGHADAVRELLDGRTGE
jgi:uncharacterized damage-inducible protein DinB